MSNNIKYVQSYVAFLDVLGFKELVYSKKAEDKKKLQEYSNSINNFVNILKEISIKNTFNVDYIVISDSIIITAEQKKIK